MLKGIDLSHNNGHVDFHALKNAGMDFCFLKASQGSGFTDPMFARDKEAAQSACLLVSPYHYFQYGDDPIEQVRHFIESAGGGFHGMLLPALDVELDSNQRTMDAGDYVDAVMEWRKSFQAKIGVMPIVYSYRDMWDWMGDPDMSGSPLWVASYRSKPSLLPGWSGWSEWQYTDHGSAPGVASGTADLDYFNGDISQLEKFLL